MLQAHDQEIRAYDCLIPFDSWDMQLVIGDHIFKLHCKTQKTEYKWNSPLLPKHHKKKMVGLEANKAKESFDSAKNTKENLAEGKDLPESGKDKQESFCQKSHRVRYL